jgi:hypothetical protein
MKMSVYQIVNYKIISVRNHIEYFGLNEISITLCYIVLLPLYLLQKQITFMKSKEAIIVV